MLLKASILINIILVVLVAYLFYNNQSIQAPNNTTTSEKDDFPLLAKRLFVENPNDIIINFTSLRQDLRGYIQKDEKPISVYFQYLPTGSSIGINDNVSFIAASLLKLPTVMYVYKLIEDGQVSLNDEITLTNELIDENYGELWKKGPGTKVTIKDLVENSLVYSDNTAHNALFHQVSKGSPEEVYDSLDIPRQVVAGSPAVTVKNYSSILRSLYFSSYLNFQSSQNILELLTRIQEGSNLRSNIPEDIKISQKIGIYEFGDDEDKYIYSDCGIFYVPNRPYLLCIMAQGDEETTSNYTRDISKMVYKYVTAVNSKK